LTTTRSRSLSGQFPPCSTARSTITDPASSIGPCPRG
jgi:hypothetical protein